MPKASLVSVVEDDQLLSQIHEKALEVAGYSVEALPSAADFLASGRLAETDCVIADVHMPGMTGFELYRRLVEMGYTTPTILVTAYPDDDVRARALNEGVVRYLPKPVDEKRLIQCLRAALHSGDPRARRLSRERSC